MPSLSNQTVSGLVPAKRKKQIICPSGAIRHVEVSLRRTNEPLATQLVCASPRQSAPSGTSC